MRKVHKAQKNTRGITKGNSDYKSKTRQKKKHEKLTKYNNGQRSLRKLEHMTSDGLFQTDAPLLLRNAFSAKFGVHIQVPFNNFIIWLTGSEEIQHSHKLLWSMWLITKIGGYVGSLSGSRNLKQMRRWLLKRCAK